MTLENLAAVAEIVSSIAIVSTLFYLALQTRQTNHMLIGNSRQSAIASDVALLSTTIEHPEILAKIVGLDAEEAQIYSLLILFLRSREFQWFQFQNGVLDRLTFESYLRPLATWLGSDVGSAYWENNQQDFDPAFSEFVNEWIKIRASPRASSVPANTSSRLRIGNRSPTTRSSSAIRTSDRPPKKLDWIRSAQVE